MYLLKKTNRGKISIFASFILIIASLTMYVPSVQATSQSFSYTGAEQTWVVPGGVTSITVDVLGAGGAGTLPGKGGRVRSTHTVTAGETLYIYVGGAGAVSTGGFNGGGGGSQRNGGGGASDIRQSGNAVGNRIVVAGGGGGGGVNGSSGDAGGQGGNGGNTTGQDGSNGAFGATPGGGGTSSAGGAGGGDSTNEMQAGGSGGGGYYAGGGSSGGGGAGTSGNSSTGGSGGAIGATNPRVYGSPGGGGGASYSGGTNVTHTQGYQTGNGQITIYYPPPTSPTTPTLDSPADGAVNQSVTQVFTTTSTNSGSTNLQYKIQLCTDSAMTTSCQTFDQTSSQTGWSGQNAETSTAYTSGTQATYTIQSALATSTTYYWRSYAINNTAWSSTQTPRSFTTGTNACADYQVFSYTGAQQTWVVPAGITSIYADVYGAKGGGNSPGLGGRVRTTLTTTPSETLNIYVGGAGSSTAGGYNGGGNAASRSGGGGASDIRQGGTALSNRIVVAGGGGGSGKDGASYGLGPGGDGGGTTGANGTDGVLNGGLKGNGGTSSAGGNGGAIRAGGYGTQYGGCGGGGYWGGGGGSANTAGGNGTSGTGGAGGTSGGTLAYGGGGGGGGSSYSSGTNTTHNQGVQNGAGQITITAGTCTAPNAPTLDSPANAALYQSITPVLKTTTSDVEGNDVKYKIELCSDSACNTVIQTFDQTSSQTGWSGQNAQTSTAYKSGTQAIYTVQSALSYNTTYYWRSYAIDLLNTGANYAWSATQTPRSFTTKPGGCGEPVSGNHSIASPCAFTGTINGVDAGSGSTNTAVLTVTTGGSLTVLSDQTAAVGSLSLTGGAITIVDGGSIKIGTPIYLPDNDDDGYPTSVTTTQYLTGGTHYARRSQSLDYDDTPGSGATIYPGTVCGGTCSINSTSGTCVAVAAGENGTAACARCDGVSLSPVNFANGTQDNEGPSNFCNTTHYACNGSGACTAPTTNTCYARTPSTTCTAKCTALSAIACVTSWIASNCSSGSTLCSSTSGSYQYCLCTVYTY